MKLKLIVCLSLLVCFINAQAYYCANTGGFLDVGVTTAEAEKACGKPTEIKKGRGEDTTTVPVEQWFYERAQLTDTGIRSRSVGGSVPIIFTIQDNKVSEIKLAGEDILGTSICTFGGRSVNVGDSKGQLSSVCGRPRVKNKTVAEVSTGKVEDFEIWFYEYPYQEKAALKFINGILKEIKTE